MKANALGILKDILGNFPPCGAFYWKEIWSINKWGKELNRQFSKEQPQTASEYTKKKCSISLAIKKMQIKMTLSQNNSEWVSSRKQTRTNANMNVGLKKKTIRTICGNIN
jgi:hypothetical protein